MIVTYLDEKKLHSNQPKQLEGHKVFPVEDIELFEQLENASDAFWEKYGKKAPLSCVNSGMIDGEAALIVLTDLPQGTLVDLPAKFEEYSVFVDYEVIELAAH